VKTGIIRHGAALKEAGKDCQGYSQAGKSVGRIRADEGEADSERLVAGSQDL